MMHTKNRERLYDVAEGALIVMTAYDAMQLSGDMETAFLQEASFWWLTGINEPGWKVILDSIRREAILVRPERNEIDMIFNGGLDDAAIIAQSGIDEIIGMKDFELTLRRLRRRHAAVKTIAQKYSYMFVPNPAPRALQDVLERIFDSVTDCSVLLHRLRAIKQPFEIETMKKAIAMTVAAFEDMRRKLPELKTEYAVEAEFTYHFRRHNAHHAYEPIVAAGKNACVLHYTQNEAKIAARDMVLIDIGARYHGYSADITRTYCVKPTKRQAQVHAAVETAQQQVIALIRPGLPVTEYIRACDQIMKEALHSIGLLEDENDDETYRRYFPHAMSHGLGVDTHDSLGAPRYFEAGMVITVEPGIYIPEEGIGVRIEDDILVTVDGHENLSAALSTAF